MNVEPEEETIEMNGVTIHYVRVGKGPHVIFPQPGILGTGRTDYLEMIELFDKDKYTIILWDPIGRGKSQFPDRRDFIFNNEFRDIEAKTAGDFMDKLGIKRYSLLGWCYSGQIALRIAAARKENVNKVILWSTHAYVTEEPCVKIEKFGKKLIAEEATNDGMDYFTARVIKANCSEKHFKFLAKAMIDGYWDTLRNNGGNVCIDVLPDVESEVLVLHGDEDTVCTLEQATYIVQHLKRAKLHRFPTGGHSIHLRSPQDVYEVVDEFLQS